MSRCMHVAMCNVCVIEELNICDVSWGNHTSILGGLFGCYKCCVMPLVGQLIQSHYIRLARKLVSGGSSINLIWTPVNHAYCRFSTWAYNNCIPCNNMFT